MRDGRSLIIRHSHIKGGLHAVAGSVGGCVGHRGGAHIEAVTRVVGGGQRGAAVVVGRRSRPSHHRFTIAAVGSLVDVGGRTGNARVLVIGDRHVEGGGHSAAIHIGHCVGHRGGADREGVSGIVVARDGGDAAVVRGRRGRPGVDCSAVIRIVGQHDVGGHTSDDGVLVIRDGHREARGSHVAGLIHGGVGHHRDAHCEQFSWSSIGREGGQLAVVGCRRQGPSDVGVAESRVCRAGDVGRHVGDHGSIRVGGALGVERGRAGSQQNQAQAEESVHEAHRYRIWQSQSTEGFPKWISIIYRYIASIACYTLRPQISRPFSGPIGPGEDEVMMGMRPE